MYFDRPDVLADLTFYETSAGGRILPAATGYRCPCSASSESGPFFDARFNLGEAPMNPGERRRVRISFLSALGEEMARRAGTIYLWEGRFVGEASLVE